MRQGSWFRGRPVTWDADAQAIEQERQQWVYEQVSGLNECIAEFTVDPGQAYRAHRGEYERTGDLLQLALMLEYVR